MIATLILAQVLTRTISCYGYPSDRAGHRTASGLRMDPEKYTCAVPYKKKNGRIIWEFP